MGDESSQSGADFSQLRWWRANGHRELLRIRGSLREVKVRGRSRQPHHGMVKKDPRGRTTISTEVHEGAGSQGRRFTRAPVHYGQQNLQQRVNDFINNAGDRVSSPGRDIWGRRRGDEACAQTEEHRRSGWSRRRSIQILFLIGLCLPLLGHRHQPAQRRAGPVVIVIVVIIVVIVVGSLR